MYLQYEFKNEPRVCNWAYEFFPSLNQNDRRDFIVVNSKFEK